jgi:hypothetical protein
MVWLTKAKAAMSGQAAVAREEKQEQLVLEKLAEVQVKSSEAEERISSLESSLQDEKLQVQAKSLECSELLSQLELVLEKSTKLSDVVKAELARYDALYKKLHVEKKARQRGQSQKDVLQEQMSILLSARKSGDEKNTAKHVNSLLHW